MRVSWTTDTKLELQKGVSGNTKPTYNFGGIEFKTPMMLFSSRCGAWMSQQAIICESCVSRRTSSSRLPVGLRACWYKPMAA